MPLPLARFTANIAFLFAERPFLERIDAAKAAGFSHVECHFPYDVPLAELKARLDDAGMHMSGLNTAPGDVSKGEWGLAGTPGREDAFRRTFDEALTYASALKSNVIHVMAGSVGEGGREAGLDTYVANLRRAGREAASAGITLVLEPLNYRDRPGYLVTRSDEIVEILGRIGEPNVKLLFDFYHVQIMEGDLIRRLERHLPHIGHIQIAAAPSRAEPDEGEIAYRAVLEAVARVGYGGLVGLEYKPRGRTEDGLRWMGEMGVG